MISDSLGIANLALNHLGQKRIAALDTTTEIGRKMDAAYEPALYQALRDIRPNFAKKRVIFHHVVTAEKTITGATATDPVVVTVASHGLSNGQTIAIWDASGMTELNGKRYLVQNVTTSTFELQDENGNDIDGSEFTAYVSGGKCGLVADAPAYGFSYRYQLPSDYIILLELNGDEDLSLAHSLENGELLTDESELKGRYIYYNSDVTKWDSDFIMLMSYKLAELTAMSIANLSSLAKTWSDKYNTEKPAAKATKSQEAGINQGPQRAAVVNTWINARSGS